MVVKVLIESLHKTLPLIFLKNPKNTAIELYECTKLPVEIWRGEGSLNFHVGTRTVAC
jgi:hypothetical protein